MRHAELLPGLGGLKLGCFGGLDGLTGLFQAATCFRFWVVDSSIETSSTMFYIYMSSTCGLNSGEDRNENGFAKRRDLNDLPTVPNTCSGPQLQVNQPR